jgi:hypothetical protein
VALALCTSPGAAGIVTFSWTAADTGNGDGVLQPGESAVLTLWALMDPRPTAFGWSIYDIAGDGAWQSRGTIDRYENPVDHLAVGPGELHADNSITGIEAFQLPPFFGHADHSNPLAMYEIVWTPIEYGHWAVGFWSENHLDAWVYTDNFGSAEEYEILLEPGGFTVVPAPGSFVALGVAFGAGAVFGRRKGR